MPRPPSGVWLIRSAAEPRCKTMADGQEFVIQEPAEGILERVQTVFDRGRLVAIHGYRQMAEDLGGGDIAKLGLRQSEPSFHRRQPPPG